MFENVNNWKTNAQFVWGGRRIPFQYWGNEHRIFIQFGFHSALKDEIKLMDGSRWHGKDEPPMKAWSVKNCRRNRFQLARLCGVNVYEHYDKPLEEWTTKSNRPLFEHQTRDVSFFRTRRHCILAGSMGIGKSLTCYELMESDLTIRDWWWVGPRAALTSVAYDSYVWDCKRHFKRMTYQALVKTMKEWTPGHPAPMGVIFDECQKIKNPTSQVGQAAFALAEAMRDEYGRDCYIILMSGTPAPKDPTDWFWLTEIACPGFLREGNILKLKNRLAIIEMAEGFAGGRYPKLITWLDDEKKCAKCGRLADSMQHDPLMMTESFYHVFQPSRNEITTLYQRMQGLVIVEDKAKLLDLPEKVYRVWECKPNQETINAAKLIKASAKSAIETLTLLRELSDGFQYQKVANTENMAKCPVCEGNKIEVEHVDKETGDVLTGEEIRMGRRRILNEHGVQIGYDDKPIEVVRREITCYKCSGKGEVPTIEQHTAYINSPKEQALEELLEMYEDEGRLVVFAGFTGAIDKCVGVCRRNDWKIIRIDGRGWWSNMEGGDLQLLKFFNDKVSYKKIAIVAQPGAGGIGLNFTASSAAVYYSNTFKSDDRDQSEDRIHRPGADHNRGCTIWDIYHLPTDKYVHDNIKRKRDLQKMTMGILAQEIDAVLTERET